MYFVCHVYNNESLYFLHASVIYCPNLRILLTRGLTEGICGSIPPKLYPEASYFSLVNMHDLVCCWG